MDKIKLDLEIPSSREIFLIVVEQPTSFDELICSIGIIPCSHDLLFMLMPELAGWTSRYSLVALPQDICSLNWYKTGIWKKYSFGSIIILRNNHAMCFFSSSNFENELLPPQACIGIWPKGYAFITH